jgi:hypothetical protein
MLLRSLILLLIFSIKVYSSEIPIIIITAPSKKPQSISTVGTSVQFSMKNSLIILQSIF